MQIRYIFSRFVKTTIFKQFNQYFMNQYFGTGGETPEEILELLRNNCDDTTQFTYMHHFTPEEADEKRNELIDNILEIERLEEKLASIKAEFKGKIDPMRKDNKLLVHEVKDGGVNIKDGDVFVVFDHEQGKVGYYSPQGKLLNVRPMKKSEHRQPGIFNMPKAIQPSKTDESQATGTEGAAFKFKSDDDDQPY